MALLSDVISPSPRSRETLVLIQTSLASQWLPFLHVILSSSNAQIVCVCVLHPPKTVLPESLTEQDRQRVKVLDWTGNVPGYEDRDRDGKDMSKCVYEALADAPAGPIALVIDSADTICDDLGSTPETYNILKSWHSAIVTRPAPSRLILPLPSRSPLLALLLTPAFSPSLAHLTLHPAAILHHLSTAYLTLPPPHSSPAKFWPVFSGIVARGEAETLVWGPDGTGWGDEVIVEVLVRSASGKRSVERGLEGWRKAGVCDLKELVELKGIWSKGTEIQQPVTADPTQNLPFNLTLTEAQQHSRAQVPLPYAHEGQPTAGNSNLGAIYYDPDSADDIDDDDPDEDLDI